MSIDCITKNSSCVCSRDIAFVVTLPYLATTTAKNTTHSNPVHISEIVALLDM